MTAATSPLQGSLARLAQWREATVGSLLVDAVRDRPDGVALLWPTPPGLASLTWRQVWSAATFGAGALRQCSDAARPVAIWAPNSPGWYLSLWAAALSGRPLVPLNPALTGAEATTVLTDSGATTLLAAGSYRGTDLRDSAAALHTNLAALAEVWDVDHWLTDSGVGTGATDAYGAPADAGIHPGDTLVIQYTSGTTGRPKGAVLSHRACVNAASTLMTALDPGVRQVCCSPLALHHVGALIAHALGLALIGGTYVMLDGFSAPQFLAAAAASRATHLAGVPTTYLRLLDEPEPARVPLPDVRVLMLGGSSVPPSLVPRLEERFDAPVSVAYGQSEAPAITATSLHDPAWVKAHTVGRPLPHRQVRIIDTATGESAPVGSIGEICVRTPIRMDCYHNLPDATSAAIDGDGWLHTGDLGSLDADGRLRVHARLKEMIVRGGENIYPREVENVIETHPDVAHAAVVGLPDAQWGEIVGAAVVPRAGTALREVDLSAWVAHRLAPYKRPARWRIADELPTTASGKPQKFKIVDLMAASDGG